MSRLLTWLAAVVLMLSACTSSTTTTTDTRPPETTTTSVAPPTTSTPTTTIPEGIESLPEDLQQEIIALVEVTQRLRELQFLEPPRITVLSSVQLAERVRELVQEDLEDLPAEEALYKLLGLIPSDLGLADLYTDLYGEQVAGFYDGETGELVVTAKESGFTPLEKATLVHELTHALTDQHFYYWPGYEAMIDEQRYDEAAAFLAVLEGDATLTQILYLQDLDSEERQAALAESFLTEQSTFDTAPPFIQGSLIFPYDEGFNFVQRLYDLGGFELIDDVYSQPPVSTEQILTPRDYGQDQPLGVDHARPVLSSYDEVFDSVWGELSFSLMFEQVLGDRPEAADGWGGDRFTVWFDGENVVFVLTYRGDTVGDAAEMAEALEDYVHVAMAAGSAQEHEAGTVFSGSDFAFIGLDGDTVYFVAASDSEAGEAAVAALSG